MRKTIFLFVMLLAAAPALALGPRFEWGVLAGINVPDYSFKNDNAASVKNRCGWQAGLTTSIGFNSWSIDPQILYVRHGLKVSDAGDSAAIHSNSIDVPVLINKRFFRVLNIYAGPVFTVMNHNKADGFETIELDRIRSTMSYAVGANIRLVKHFVVDLRYNGQFKAKNILNVGKLKTYNLALSVGYVF